MYHFISLHCHQHCLSINTNTKSTTLSSLNYHLHFTFSVQYLLHSFLFSSSKYAFIVSCFFLLSRTYLYKLFPLKTRISSLLLFYLHSIAIFISLSLSRICSCFPFLSTSFHIFFLVITNIFNNFL